ncbi:MAG: protein adenylyltransferase SelO family protein, partial [Burkholderiaceae bacterium]
MTTARMLTLPLRGDFAAALPELCVPWRAHPVARPQLLYFNRTLAAELNVPCADWDEADLAQVFSGNALAEGVRPVAQVYAGHQFGRFVPRLGDGRALLLGEASDRAGALHDLAFKGSGPTPFARNGDGKAAVGPMLREVLIGEALHALGIPTSRALAVVTTGEPVQRERALPGAVLTRVAASHLRVGTFEY